jgi:hypothetical protein
VNDLTLKKCGEVERNLIDAKLEEFYSATKVRISVFDQP